MRCNRLLGQDNNNSNNNNNNNSNNNALIFILRKVHKNDLFRITLRNHYYYTIKKLETTLKPFYKTIICSGFVQHVVII